PQWRPFRSGAQPPPPEPGPTHPVRTALLVEPRDGRLCVFLPPTASAEEYVELVAAVEDACAEHGTPVHLEGYGPPPDPRLRVIQVTPDPGVIEVNVHPVARWKTLSANTLELYEDARQARLGTEKFMVDGRHTGTGGGNHVVLGGATPADSPFLRRPDLLRSLLAFWLDHPALSYLFSGLFIGPTSQAPRVDEARDDALHELEIAFRQIPPPGGEPPPPWRVDRIFRDLLTDATGNTHRAEFCIDKLYSPDSATGRLGLLELRSFEMPPHARMSLVQQLLVRALVLRCWEDPYRALPTRFGTSLHDRFMLPHFVWRDLLAVIDDLAEHGLRFEPEWFGPHLEFRFPVLGRLQLDDVEIELRQALEPWHVLGEEGVAGATSRYVDSSLERIQVLVRGRSGRRHELACNGFRLPLTPTGTPDEFVAGVRFRAWQPARCLHPTIPVHAPLTFDWFDTAARRSVAGCQYHVAHPGGRAHESFPVNAFEAEGRRLARFFPFGHSPGLRALREPRENRDFPLTLDLRRCEVADDGASPS
ncbi:MAG: IMP dehydrogenase, partial [Myxococcales bacterium]|nr:IMP dehydrogenase [Myxococcales bacterium]